MLVTDGAPFMAGKVSGLAALWSTVAPQMISTHCTVHQMALCAKLCGELKMTMDGYNQFHSSLNFNIAYSTSYCQTHLPSTTTCPYPHVRWPSTGKALERFCELTEEITSFLRSSKQKKAETHLKCILDNFMANVCFLSGIFKHLNDLNVGLQGRDKTINDLLEQICAFQVKLDLLTSDLSNG